MRRTTRQKALDSTARVALGCCLGAVAGACGGMSIEARPLDERADMPDAGSETAPTAAATASSPPPAPTLAATATAAPVLACISAVEVVERALTVPLEPAQRACCTDYVTGFATPGLVPAWGPGTGLDPSLVNCCRAFAYSGDWDQTLAHEICCSGQLLPTADFQQPYCSPWGPPVPPALVLA